MESANERTESQLAAAGDGGAGGTSVQALHLHARPTSSFAKALITFLEASERTISAHIGNAHRLFDALGCVDGDGVAVGTITAQLPTSMGVLELLNDAASAQAAAMTSMHRSAIATLAKKAESTCPYRIEPQLCQQVLVVGGGPIGLRAACEMALLGHKVTLWERHDSVTRLNVIKCAHTGLGLRHAVIHRPTPAPVALNRNLARACASVCVHPRTGRLWEASALDLNALALDKIDPSWSNGKQHKASTSRLQLALLKAALLLGVDVRIATAELTAVQGYQVVIVASGAKAQRAALGGVGFTNGPKNLESTCIAVVAHFTYAGEWAKKKFADEINWVYKDAAHKEPETLRQMQRQHGLFVISPDAMEAEGIYLEQFLCYVNRAGGGAHGTQAAGGGTPPTFYFIFTFREPKAGSDKGRHTLRDWGCTMPDGTRRKLLVGAEGKSAREMREMVSDRDAVDRVALGELAKTVVRHFTLPYTQLSRRGGQVVEASEAVPAEYTQPLSDACTLLPESLSVFDFSQRECLKEASVVGHRGELCLPVGDALQEPFWPEGLGINRGLHNALDACWAANKWALATSDEQRDAVRAERQHLYEQYTATLSGRNRQCLKTDDHKPPVYYADPDSRYMRFADRAMVDYAKRARAVRHGLQRKERDRERSTSPRRGSFN